MGIHGKESTIDRNGAGGDAGVAAKRNAGLALLGRINQSGVPGGDDSGAVGKTPRAGKKTYSGGSKPAAQKNVPGGKKKQ